ncbi:hypothetical protein [Spirosoma flavum]|uniref:Outer membrane protein beta-barrel domain-containing protein n=1 Tax=Spirosoma flavum TaxID=2048557 RepID=A0ABW6ABU4_9BACT
MNNGNEMDELEKNLPDDFWRKAFEEAAETPPPRVWAAVERRLDESNGPKILPLWGTGLASSRPLLWGTGLAAAITLLLVGWWAVKTESVTRSVARVQKANQTRNVAVAPDLPSMASTVLPTNKASNEQAEATAYATKLQPRPVRPAGGSIDQSLRLQSQGGVTTRTATKPFPSVKSMEIQTELASVLLVTTPIESRYLASRMAIAPYAANEGAVVRNSERKSTTLVAFNSLTGKPMRLRTLSTIQRIVWIRPTESTMEPEVSKSQHKAREMWASVSMMPGAFNPSVSVRSAQSSGAALASSSTSNQSSVNSRANFSVAYQAGAGVQLTEHWSVESGIGYLSGNSTVETPGQQAMATAQMDLLANRNSANNNLYVDALRNSSKASNQASNAPAANYTGLVAGTSQANSSYDNRNLQTINNNYQYMQVPVQVGYQFRPRKRLSMAVLGGLLTNIFVRNTVGDALVITNKDGVYRPLSLSATMGARFRYRPSRRWSASLAGVYQPSLELGTKTDSQVQSHPTSTGMSFGVDYHF